MNKLFRTSLQFGVIISFVSFVIISCKDSPAESLAKEEVKGDSLLKEEPPIVPIEKQNISYQLVGRKEFFKQFSDSLSDNDLTILSDINRVDKNHLKRLDSIVVPTPMTLSRVEYSPFPSVVTSLQEVDKILFFAYYEEYFGAYEKGKLILTGPTNMGKSSSRTPTGLFFTNWKSKESISTVSSEWILKWNFNVSNFGGVGFHEYALPGYPASHSCMRLKAEDAMFFYSWANQWKLDTADNVIAKGTPVIIYGKYPFGKPKPWLSLVGNPNGLSISMEVLDSVLLPHLPTILKEQKNRVEIENGLVNL